MGQLARRRRRVAGMMPTPVELKGLAALSLLLALLAVRRARTGKIYGAN